jgi:alpha-L-fucosidase
LLNSTPDTTGLIPEANMKHYAAFGNEIRRRFSAPVAETKGEGTVLELSLPKPNKINHLILMEDIAFGERIRRYELSGLVSGDTWKPLCQGVSVGHKRIQKFDAVEVAKVRLQVTESVADPKIRRLAVFDVA